MRLTERRIRTLRPGRYTDDPTLCLVVKPTGGRSWVQRLVIGGRRVDRGLGGWPLVSLADARLAALSNRRTARSGQDPFAERQRQTVPTFRQAAEQTLEANRSRLSTETAARWLAPLSNHVFPGLGDRRVDSISRTDVIALLAPIWNTRPSESSKALARMRTVLDWALAHGHVAENVCANGGIKAALPSQERARAHHEAVPYREVPAALRTIAEAQTAASAKACTRFLVLTAVRSVEARGARWDEIDFDNREWRIPAERMKSRREHVVPLSHEAFRVLEARRGLHPIYCFASERTGRPLSHPTLRAAAAAVRGTIHGFRASFRTWASEQTTYPHAVCEMALAHQVGNDVERSYARSDLLEKRRSLMTEWAAYIA